MNILTWAILKKTHMINDCETFAFKYIYRHQASLHIKGKYIQELSQTKINGVCIKGKYI